MPDRSIEVFSIVGPHTTSPYSEAHKETAPANRGIGKVSTEPRTFETDVDRVAKEIQAAHQEIARRTGEVVASYTLDFSGTFDGIHGDEHGFGGPITKAGQALFIVAELGPDTDALDGWTDTPDQPDRPDGTATSF